MSFSVRDDAPLLLFYCQTKDKTITKLAILTVAILTCTLGLTGTALASSTDKAKTPTKSYKILYAKNWFVATSQADKVFPGSNTKAWLLSCSSSEGGHTIWKWNYEGSGAGGWVQFKQPTFNSYVWAAYRVALERGFKVKDMSQMSYYSPLGQALTAAYIRSIGDHFIHWSGVPKCLW